MAYSTGKKTMKSKKSFTPCAGCPNKTKCKAMGKCMKKGRK